jgi:ankyrin repeat protein
LDRRTFSGWIFKAPFAAALLNAVPSSRDRNGGRHHDLNLQYALLVATVKGDYGGVISAIRSGADPNYRMMVKFGLAPDFRVSSRPTLFFPAERDHLKVCKALLDAGADPNLTTEELGDGDFHVLHHALSHDVVKLLLSRGANANPGGITVLSPYIYGDESFRTFKLLIDRGANVNALDPYRETTLSFALGYAGGAKQIQYLLQRNAKLFAQGSDHRDPRSLLEIATRRLHWDSESLKEFRASKNKDHDLEMRKVESVENSSRVLDIVKQFPSYEVS